MGAQKFMGAQKLLRGHDASALLRRPQMAPVSLIDDSATVSLIRDLFRPAAVESKSWKKDGRQSGEHVPGGSSCGMHGQLQRVADLRLVQLPRRRQDQ